jgi:hypothetical protein
MKTHEFIKAKLESFSVELSDIELKALLIDCGISELDNYETNKAKTALAKVIPEMLLKPSIQEGDYSIKYDKDGLVAYYNLICNDLGIENKLTPPKPKINNRSYLW